MLRADFDCLLEDIKDTLAENADSTFGVIGNTPAAYDLIDFFRRIGAERQLLGVYHVDDVSPSPSGLHKPLAQLRTDAPSAIVVATDVDKERYLEAAGPLLAPEVRVIFSGYGHLAFRDSRFEEATKAALVPSLANGYPNTLVHLYQCLSNAARQKLTGVVVEFGVFKGGTTKLLSRFIESLGQSWPVIGFDTFSGFPPKRSVFDMYAHPDCVFPDEAAVRHYLEGRNIEIVTGDLVETVLRLAHEDIVLGFFDTDNYSSTSAILDVIEDRVLVGGALVFDHYTGRNRFRYTLGERMAAKRLLSDSRYFNLHDTGVFLKQS